jgi:predicted nuclease of predicted toxin-antitoxin system
MSPVCGRSGTPANGRPCVKLLFDQNLSPRLVEQLGDLFPGSAHVQSLQLDRALDVSLWDFARKNDFLLVTKDVDFSDRSALFGYPPKVIWLRLGNCTTAEIESTLRAHHEAIDTFNNDGSVGVLTIFG